MKTVATRDEGVGELLAAVERHREHLARTGSGRRREVARARASFVSMLRERLLEGALARIAQEEGHLDALAARIAARRGGPVRARRRAGLEAVPVTAPVRVPGDEAATPAPDPVALLEARLSRPFADRVRALSALTHKSYVNEHREETGEDNERLEFLGDAVVDLLVSHRLMERFPRAREGDLSKMRAAVVDETGLAAMARTLDLGSLLRLGRGEELTGGREKSSLLADAMEAVVAAVFLEGGLEAAQAMVDRFLEDAYARASAGTLDRDFKTQMQEICQGRFRVSPRYRVVAEHGPDHHKIFEVEVEVKGEPLGRGMGRSKKDAEQIAARCALETLAARPLAADGSAAAPAGPPEAAAAVPAPSPPVAPPPVEDLTDGTGAVAAPPSPPRRRKATGSAVRRVRAPPKRARPKAAPKKPKAPRRRAGPARRRPRGR